MAYAIYARAALTREDWAAAAKYAPLARKDYPLMSNADYVDGGFSTPNREWIPDALLLLLLRPAG